jgi:hypothetical protein
MRVTVGQLGAVTAAARSSSPGADAMPDALFGLRVARHQDQVAGTPARRKELTG